jgi:hypothetical protein
MNVFAHELSTAPYIEMQEALAADDFNKAIAAHTKVCTRLGDDKKEYNNCDKKFKDIEELRVSFKKLSEIYLKEGNKKEIKSLQKVHCPMYPGTWLQKPGKVANPYYGKGMLECGEKV